jgi:hypothetical protein
MVRRKKWIPPQRFLVISEEGYFSGLHNGGKFRWSFDINDAKPLNYIEQFETIKKGYIGKEIILDLIK